MILYENYQEIKNSQELTSRPGNIVLYHQPNSKGTLGIGMVMSVWKGVKAPKMVSGETPIDSCSAFRVVVLEKATAPKTWACNGTSVAFVVRVEALVAILDCEESCLASVGQKLEEDHVFCRGSPGTSPFYRPRSWTLSFYSGRG